MHDRHRGIAGILKVADRGDNGSQPAPSPALPRPASPVPATLGQEKSGATHDFGHSLWRWLFAGPSYLPPCPQDRPARPTAMQMAGVR